MHSDSKQKFLVLRLSSVGDVVLITPFLRVLRAQYPGSEIHVATRAEFRDLLLHHPAIDRLLVIDISGGRKALEQSNHELLGEQYDAVFDLHDNFRTRLLRNGLSSHIHVIDKRQFKRFVLIHFGRNLYHEIVPVPERYIETGSDYGLTPDMSGPEVFLSPEVTGGIRLTLRKRGWDPPDTAVGICPGAKHFSKRWPVQRYMQLAEALLSRGKRIVLLGGREDLEAAGRIAALDGRRITNLCGELSFLETAAAMDFCSVLVTNDSGLMHLATARQRPVVALFGSTVQELGFFPYHSPSVVVEIESLSCRPCTHIGRKSCPKKHFRCLEDIGAEAVLAAMDELEGKHG